MINKDWWKGKTATTVRRKGNTGLCQYHDTVVVEWTTDRITLNLGGYDSPTTRNRMSAVAAEERLHYVVVRQRGQTYVVYEEGHRCNVKTVKQPIGGDYVDKISFPRFQGYVEDCPDCGMHKLRTV